MNYRPCRWCGTTRVKVRGTPVRCVNMCERGVVRWVVPVQPRMFPRPKLDRHGDDSQLDDVVKLIEDRQYE